MPLEMSRLSIVVIHSRLLLPVQGLAQIDSILLKLLELLAEALLHEDTLRHLV